MKKKKWLRALIRRRFIIIILLFFELIFLLQSFLFASRISTSIELALTVASLLICVFIIQKRERGAYRLSWTFLILLFPVFGGMFYLFCRYQKTTSKAVKHGNATEEKMKNLFYLPGNALENAEKKFPEHIQKLRYLEKFAGFPVYENSRTEYLSPGEKFFPKLLEELEKAEKYIFIEFFIISEGLMWNKILEILTEKAQKGVKVRIIYDDIGCFLTVPKDFKKSMESLGIECTVFNKFRPLITTIQNNRDHRKIVSIDGKAAFTGGINLADEYINAVERFGYWKDAGIFIEGHAAWSLTMIFLQMWEFCNQTNENCADYYPWKNEKCSVLGEGFVQPYADSPIDMETAGENVYLNMITGAKKYLYINTPYLIPDDNLISALCLAAKSGVDVRIITPHKWDKWIVHVTTRSYYRELLQNGIKIYEFSKGFLHAKTFVSDDITATVGTTNLDFRSLYLHFECGVQLYGGTSIKAIKDDFLETLSDCQEITPEQCKTSVFMRILQNFLRLFAPLM